MADKKKVLAVDDETDVLLIIKTALMSEGYEVRTESGGQEALSAVGEFAPDLIILDMMMPEMDGFEVLRRLRENQKTEAVPVIMLTGVSDKSRIQQALNAGIEYYIVKPFEFHDLMSKVKIALSNPAAPGL